MGGVTTYITFRSNACASTVENGAGRVVFRSSLLYPDSFVCTVLPLLLNVVVDVVAHSLDLLHNSFIIGCSSSPCTSELNPIWLCQTRICSAVPTIMLTSRSTPSVSAVSTDIDDQLKPSHSHQELHQHLKSKRVRCFSKIFQTSRSEQASGSTSRKHAKKMSASRNSSSSPPSTPSTPGSTTSMEPSSKRVLRDVVLGNESTSEPGVIFVTSEAAAASQWIIEADGWKEELDKLAISARNKQGDPEWTWKEALPLAISISKPWIRNGQTASNQAVVAGPSFAEWNKNDHLSCPKCGGVLHHVVTLSCGHSYCRKCTNSLDHCSKCGRAAVVQPDQLKTNVTVSTLVEKWWADELKAVDLRNLGNQAFGEQHYDQALEKYHQALQSAPTDFTLLSNRSNILAKIGKYEEALKDADQVIRLRPDWPKGHYRRAMALKGLCRYEDALISLLHCAAMERTLLSDVREEIAKVLFAVTLSAAKQVNSTERASKAGDNCSGGSGSEDSNLSSSEEAASPPINTMAGLTSEEEEEDEVLRNSPERMMALTIHHQIHPKLHQLIDRLLADYDKLKKTTLNIGTRVVDKAPPPNKVETSDFECTLCCRLMWQPVTTPCGHSFCRTCLDRCMDHTPACPLCKTSLEEYLAERRQCLTEFLDFAMTTYLPEEYAERGRLHEEEMKELASSNNIPIFICTMAYPTVRCPLHVFEPRYRLMIRRCMESGSRQFGMCSYVQDQPHGFAEFGTMLEVRDVEFFTDGRSVVDTVGGRRFRVLRRDVLDGYCTATVEYLVDQAVEPAKMAALIALHDRVRQEAQNWIASAPTPLRQRILQHFGVMPDVEPDWMTMPNGPSWLWWLMAILPLNPKAQVAILSMTQLEKRLEAVQRGVAYVRQRTL